MAMTAVPDLRKKENLHIAFWLIKDFCWISAVWLEPLKWLGVSMVLPTLILSVYLTWLGRNHRSDLYHNIAVTLWICANSVWMFGEFFFEDTTRAIALPFFLGGIVSVSWFYLTEFLKKKSGADQTG